MIAYIKGTLEVISENSVIVEANGVGYEIICANPFRFENLRSQPVLIYTYHYVREDIQVLYGFKRTDEKTLFSKLLNVSGIGPKGALSILGSCGVNDFVLAIEEENEKFLTNFPGVGKKTARQMILDLKGKLPFEYKNSTSEYSQENNGVQNEKESVAIKEALEALRSLGYSEKEIKQLTPLLKEEQYTNADDYVRKGLSLMMQK
ncbi:Holliday junction branch migration protein RuvA [Aquibacillus albus]|uniref:Holliday junction branch migration complex subunit RuvA n=1 Tax=Aquibacillus albus TaxID=1168171 RepID=A0ABS2MUP4_9BACI|nr:Holliday junction branch migration protein RuvA [Aquibacillus albus]MBM7569538.1 Holliday junction DNA helicase RuvA [Aquibacillus albus]